MSRSTISLMRIGVYQMVYKMDCTTEPRFIMTEEGCMEQVTSGLNKKGQELPDPVPLAPPVGITAVDPLQEMVRRVVRGEYLRHAAELEGVDTFEEAEDFDIEDDPLDPRTPYEAVFDPPATPVAPSPSDAPGSSKGTGEPLPKPSAPTTEAPSEDK